MKNYKPESKDTWTGRIDSYDDFSAFRWHQWVEEIDLFDENIKPFEGKFAIGILGFESDLGIQINKGRAGASTAPAGIRKSLSSLPCNFPQEFKIYDCGNITTESGSLREVQTSLSIAVSRMIDLNLYPILLGGGHEISYGHYLGLYRKYATKDQNVGVINFDAHFDFRPYDIDGPSSGTGFRQIYDLNIDNGTEYHYLPIGIQRHSNTVSLFNFADDNNIPYILAKDIRNNGVTSTFETINSFLRKVDNIYLTVDADGFSSAFAPGVSAPQPLGLDPEDVITIIKYIVNTGKIVGFDIAEVSPRYDHDNTTTSLASIIIYAFVTEMIRKRFEL